ncbi:hypothetical protein TNCV_2530231 [Trichonephila clavipes]|nr:hypothetical protein TNCV_2530231 [Trichonephila clavipes]
MTRRRCSTTNASPLLFIFITVFTIRISPNHTLRAAQRAFSKCRVFPGYHLLLILDQWKTFEPSGDNGCHLQVWTPPYLEDVLWEIVDREWSVIFQDVIHILILCVTRRIASHVSICNGPTS